jgi:predicted RNA-binding protein YlxR (DUF448 family)
MMRPRRIPLRSCVVCRQTSDKRVLLRVVRLPAAAGGHVVADPTSKRSGRGAYVCASLECIEKARKQNRFQRSLNVTSAEIDSALFADLLAQCTAREPKLGRSDEPMS